MFRLTKWMVAPLLAAGMMFAADTPKADAGGFSISIGGGNYGSHGYRSYRPSYGYGYQSYRPSYNSYYGHAPSYRVPVYRRSVGHYDYHPTEIRRHGNHYDVTPGHYDYHRGGHYGHHGHH
ncbi:hypothetical protein K227x_52870 [Rubripirellula lacrimiformis]|uniref:Uncharacterized protein n=1 Tax=Rubripirellula lacrimiformis TaxID=1930273 RepID=A0A517NIA1_9BACT|nr:hypothetical protein [Rubripirellula lacrimiformis]QDT06866.1 hypothetical protein K227x_52870 [Rubripirellula lacrimiformis]